MWIADRFPTFHVLMPHPWEPIHVKTNSHKLILRKNVSWMSFSHATVCSEGTNTTNSNKFKLVCRLLQKNIAATLTTCNQIRISKKFLLILLTRTILKPVVFNFFCRPIDGHAETALNDREINGVPPFAFVFYVRHQICQEKMFQQHFTCKQFVNQEIGYEKQCCRRSWDSYAIIK